MIFKGFLIKLKAYIFINKIDFNKLYLNISNINF